MDARRWAVRIAATACLALGAGGAAARNLYPNGDFDDVDQIDGWLATVGEVGHGDADASGCPASGSVVTTSEETGPGDHGLRGWGPCVTLAETTLVDLRFVYRGGLPGPSADVGVGVLVYDEPSCLGTARDASVVLFQHVAAWTEFQGAIEVPGGGSFRLTTSGSSTEPGALEVDEIRATAEGYVFLDGFDGGGTCRWSHLEKR